MSALSATRLGFEYPHPGALDRLLGAIEQLDPGPVRTHLGRFAGAIAEFELGQWEEVHTRTLDLSPLFVPYVGHLAWGESYRRGAFMAELQRAQIDAGVDQRGELPDHIGPILSYLDEVDDPLADLTEVLPSAISTMKADLEKADAGNPYRHLLAAAAAAVHDELAEGAIA